MMLMFAAIISTVASCACDSILEAHFASSEPIHDFYLNWTIWEYDNYWFIVLAYVLLFSLLTIGFKQIRLSGGLIFLFGFILYFIGYDYEGTGESLWALCSRSTMSSLEMFLGRSDLIEVHHNWHRNAAYMAFFSVTHLCALSVSIMLLFKLFAKRIYYFFKLYFYSYFNSEKTLFLFFGYNENAKILAQDIHRQSSTNKIVFINLFRNNEKEEHEESSFLKLIGLFNFSNLDIEDIWDLGIGAFFARSKKDIQELSMWQAQVNYSKADNLRILKQHGLNNLRRWILRSKRVTVFFMSDDMENNLLSLDQFVMDPYLQNNLPADKRITIYCHATRNNASLLREQQYLCYKNLEVHIIDSSYLAICQLKKDYRNLPVNSVDIHNGAATSPFTGMVVGFGETGQEALGFLYEYGAFVNPQNEPSDFKCIVLDKDMDTIRPQYLTKRPGMKNDVGERVEFWSFSVKDQEFWDKLSQHIISLNYVVIALGDDRLNASFALDLYEYAIRYRKNDLNHFRIFVRTYNSRNETRLNYIEQYLNNCNTPESFASVFTVFGYSDKIFSCDSILVHNEESDIMKSVQRYYKAYSALTGVTNADWCQRRSDTLSLGDKHYKIGEHFPQLMFKLRELTRYEHQDYENYFHMNTKLILMGLSCGKRPESLTEVEKGQVKLLHSALIAYLRSEKEFSTYAQDIQDTVIALSATEHFRWNNSHTLMGYVYQDESGDEKKLRDIRMTHKCIVPWNSLDKDTQKFDAMVVATTLNISYPELYHSC